MKDHHLIPYSGGLKLELFDTIKWNEIEILKVGSSLRCINCGRQKEITADWIEEVCTKYFHRRSDNEPHYNLFYTDIVRFRCLECGSKNIEYLGVEITLPNNIRRQKMQKIEIMRNTEIFRELPDEDLEKISLELRERIYPPNCAIFREGDSGEAIFIIKSGQVEIKKRDEDLGSDVTIATLGTGAVFGEIDFTTGNPLSITAITIAPTEVLILASYALFGHPSLSILIKKIITKRR